MLKKIYVKNNQEYYRLKNKFNSFFKEYEYYVNHTKLFNSKSSNKSNKAISYSNYLIKLFMLYEENNEQIIQNPFDISLYSYFFYLKNTMEYKEYNKKERGFPNACLNYYFTFFTNYLVREEMVLDYISDEITNNTNDSSVLDKNLFFEQDISGPLKRMEPVNYQKKIFYKRNILEAKKAKEKVEYKCEFNINHRTFISFTNNKEFIEAHHLIPMAMQGLFNYNIDFSGNIICLCPNCHRRIHYGVNSDREEMIKKLYLSREDQLKDFKININLETLSLFYNC